MSGFEVWGLRFVACGLGVGIGTCKEVYCRSRPARKAGSAPHLSGTYTPYPYRGTSLIKNSPLPWGHHRSLGIVLLKGPRSALLLISEVHMYPTPDGQGTCKEVYWRRRSARKTWSAPHLSGRYSSMS